MKTYFLKLFEYDEWANERVVGCLNQQQVNDGKVIGLMGHVFVAQLVWANRVMGIPPPALKLWDDYKVAQLTNLRHQAVEQWRKFFRENDDLSRKITYTNFSGKTFTNDVQNIMTHVIHHSTYHRGQVAILLPSLGFQAVNTDFITYERTLGDQLQG
jgi:uncharacterized damage-inducible protein DinB